MRHSRQSTLLQVSYLYFWSNTLTVRAFLTPNHQHANQCHTTRNSVVPVQFQNRHLRSGVVRGLESAAQTKRRGRHARQLFSIAPPRPSAQASSTPPEEKRDSTPTAGEDAADALAIADETATPTKGAGKTQNKNGIASRAVGRILSFLTVMTTWLLFRFLLKGLNKVTCSNRRTLVGAILHRGDQGLLTVSNHVCVYDDPGLWSALVPFWRYLVGLYTASGIDQTVIYPKYHGVDRSACKISNMWASPRARSFSEASNFSAFGGETGQKKMRWAMCTDDIYNANRRLKGIFDAGKTLPIKRSRGMEQPLFKVFFQKLEEGEWGHIFAEGAIRQPWRFGKGEPMLGDFKAGIGRLLLRGEKLPMVLPMYHIGMHQIAPESPVQKRGRGKLVKTLPNIGRKVRVYIGEPIDVRPIVEKCRSKIGDVRRLPWTTRSSKEEVECHKEIAEFVREHVLKLEAVARKDYYGGDPSSYYYTGTG